MKQRTYATSDVVDFVIVGAGAAGGVLAKELATRGFSVVVLEQGPWRTQQQFSHDEVAVNFGDELLTSLDEQPQTARRSDRDDAVRRRAVVYAAGVGGSSVHFSGNYWRMRPVDFRERSLLGPIAGGALIAAVGVRPAFLIAATLPALALLPAAAGVAVIVLVGAQALARLGFGGAVVVSVVVEFVGGLVFLALLFSRRHG